MRIWTTPYLNSLLRLPDFPVRLISDREVRRAFLLSAGREDMAIVAYDAGYREFLAEVRSRGIAGPVVLLAQEPCEAETLPAGENVMVLDVTRTGIDMTRAILRFVLHVAVHYSSCGVPIAGTTEPVPSRSEYPPVEDAGGVMERLRYAMEKEVPVMAAIEVREAGEEVTARGGCEITRIENGLLTLEHFRHALLFSSLKPGVRARLYFPYRQENHYCIVTVKSATDKAICTTVPERLYPTREMRIQPNPAKPVRLYVLLPNEPTHELPVFDISPRGLGFLCSRDLPVDTAYGFTVLLPDPEALVVTTGIIRFKKEGSYGIRYGAEIHPHPWDSESIAKYIMKRESEIIGLLRNNR